MKRGHQKGAKKGANLPLPLIHLICQFSYTFIQVWVFCDSTFESSDNATYGAVLFYMELSGNLLQTVASQLSKYKYHGVSRLIEFASF